MHNNGDLPDDIEALRAMVLEQRASIARMRQDMAERDLEIERLKAQIDKLKRMQFGRKSEKLDKQIERLETELEELTGSRGVADVRNARIGRGSASASTAVHGERTSREALLEHLPREEHVLEPEPTCSECGGEMQPLGEDISEQLGRITAAFKVIRTIRRKKSVPAAAISRSHRRPVCRFSVASRTQACLATYWYPSTPIINRFIANPRSPHATT